MFRFFRQSSRNVKLTFPTIFIASSAGLSCLIYKYYQHQKDSPWLDKKAEKYIKHLSSLSTPYSQFGLVDMTIEVDNDVYPYGNWSRLYSQFIAEHYDLVGKKVIDSGTSTGGTAIKMAQAGATVTAFDISPCAVDCARKNVHLNGLDDKVKVLQSNGLACFKDALGNIREEEKAEYFLFVSGAPWSTINSDEELRAIDANGNYWIKKAFFDIKDNFIQDIMRHAPELMTHDGKIIITGCKNGEDRLKRLCNQNAMHVIRIFGNDVHEDGNIHYVYELQRKDPEIMESMLSQYSPF